MSRPKKRFGADEQKRKISAQPTTPRMSAAQIVRRHAVNTNLIFKWLKNPRVAPEAKVPGDGTVFLPVVIDCDIVEGDIFPDALAVSPSVPQSRLHHDVGWSAHSG